MSMTNPADRVEIITSVQRRRRCPQPAAAHPAISTHRHSVTPPQPTAAPPHTTATPAAAALAEPPTQLALPRSAASFDHLLCRGCRLAHDAIHVVRELERSQSPCLPNDQTRGPTAPCMCIFAVGQPAQRPHQKLRGSPDRPRRTYGLTQRILRCGAIFAMTWPRSGAGYGVLRISRLRGGHVNRS